MREEREGGGGTREGWRVVWSEEREGGGGTREGWRVVWSEEREGEEGLGRDGG